MGLSGMIEAVLEGIVRSTTLIGLLIGEVLGATADLAVPPAIRSADFQVAIWDEGASQAAIREVFRVAIHSAAATDKYPISSNVTPFNPPLP